MKTYLKHINYQHYIDTIIRWSAFEGVYGISILIVYFFLKFLYPPVMSFPALFLSFNIILVIALLIVHVYDAYVNQRNKRKKQSGQI